MSWRSYSQNFSSVCYIVYSVSLLPDIVLVGQKHSPFNTGSDISPYPCLYYPSAGCAFSESQPEPISSLSVPVIICCHSPCPQQALARQVVWQSNQVLQNDHWLLCRWFQIQLASYSYLPPGESLWYCRTASTNDLWLLSCRSSVMLIALT